MGSNLGDYTEKLKAHGKKKPNIQAFPEKKKATVRNFRLLPDSSHKDGLGPG